MGDLIGRPLVIQKLLPLLTDGYEKSILYEIYLFSLFLIFSTAKSTFFDNQKKLDLAGFIYTYCMSHYLKSNSRVQISIGDVDQEIDNYYENSIQNNLGLNQWVIAGHDPFVEQPAYPRPGKNGFYNYINIYLYYQTKETPD